MIGCATDPTEETTEDSEEDQEVNCGDCDDGNKCTTDICSGEKKECIHVAIKRCCGDSMCEEGETCMTCEEDCGKCYDLQNLQRDLNRIYKRKSALAMNRVIGKRYGEVLSPDYDFYDSVFITAIDIKEKENFLGSFEDFEAFIERIGKDRFDAFIAEIGEAYPI
jgi:hypothetical protein